MSSLLNEGEAEEQGRSNYLSGGFDNEQRRVRRVSLKQNLFKLVNLLTFQNVVTNTLFIILLLVEFTQFLGFVFYELSLASTTTSLYSHDSTNSSNNSIGP